MAGIHSETVADAADHLPEERILERISGNERIYEVYGGMVLAVVGFLVRHEGSLSLTFVNNTFGDEFLKASFYGDDADIESIGELAFGKKLVSRRKELNQILYVLARLCRLRQNLYAVRAYHKIHLIWYLAQLVIINIIYYIMSL